MASLTRYQCFSEGCDYAGERDTFYGPNNKFECPKCHKKDNIRTEFNITEYIKAVDAAKKINEGPVNDYKYKPMTVQDILKFTKSKDFVIDEVFYPNTVNCLVSEFSSFKSILAIYTAICISNGTEWFGYKTTKGNVLIIDNENSIQQMQSRYNSLIAGMGFKAEDMNIFYLIREGKLTDDNYLEYVVDFIKTHNIKFIIIDTMIRSQNGLKENDASDMSLLYDRFCKLIINDSAVLFLHHMNKQGKFRGSTDILGMCDSEFEINRPVKQGPKFVLTNEKNRMGEIDPIEGTVDYDKKTNVTTIEGVSVPRETSQKEEASKFEEARQYIMNYAEAHKTFKGMDLSIDVEAYNADHQENQISKHAVKRAMSWLISKKKIASGMPKRGSYTLLEDGANSTLDEFNDEVIE